MVKRERIKVLVRLRPSEGEEECVECIGDNQVRVMCSGGGLKSFHFDHVLDGSASQQQVYSSVDPLVASAVRGYNATVFAYGCTGSGKTHTICGPDGIVPRAIQRIFDLARELTEQDSETLVLVHMGYVELYNNQFRDLLNSSTSSSSSLPTSMQSLNDTEKIELRSDKNGSVVLSGPATLRTPVTSVEQAMQLVEEGMRQRMTGRTDCNEHSSRSHSILTFHIESRQANKKEGPTLARLGKLHLVDLAGSERLSMSGASGSALTETQNINLSLTNLGDVLSALSKLASAADNNKKNASAELVPYRNSKLTYFLKDSLGGNSKTVMIANIRTPVQYRQQTLMTLMYASRAKRIQNHTEINTDREGNSKASALFAEVERLRAHLRQREADFEALQRQLPHLSANELEDRRRLEKIAILSQENEAEKKRLQECLKQVVHNHRSTLAMQQEQYNMLQSKLIEYQTVFTKQRREIETLRESIRELSTGASESEVNELKTMVEKLASALQQAREELTVKDQRIALAEKRAAETDARLRDLTTQSGLSHVESDEVKNQLQALQHRYDALRSTSVEALKQVEEAHLKEQLLQQEIKQLRKAGPAKCSDCSALRKKYNTLTLALETQVHQVTRQKDDTIDQLKEQLEKLRNQTNAADEEKTQTINQLKEQLEKLRNQTNAADEEKTQTINQLKEQLESARKQANTANEEKMQAINQLKEQLSAVDEEKTQTINRLEEQLTSRSSDEEETMKNLREELATALQHAKIAKEESIRMSQERDRLVETISFSETIASQMQKLRDQANLALQRSLKEKDVLQTSLEAQQSKVIQLESENAALSSQLEQTQTEWQDKFRTSQHEWMSQLNRAVVSAESLTSQNVALQEKIQAIKTSQAKQLKALTQAVDQARSQQCFLQEEKGRLEWELRKVSEERDSLRAEKEQAKGNLDHSETLLERLKEEHRTRIEQATRETEEVRQALAVQSKLASEQVRALEKRNKQEMKTKMLEMRNQLHRLASELKHLRSSMLAVKQSSHKSIQDCSASVVGSLERVLTRLGKKEQMIQTRQQKFREALGEIHALKRALEHERSQASAHADERTQGLMEQVSQFKQRYEDATKDINEMRVALQSAETSNEQLSDQIRDVEFRLHQQQEKSDSIKSQLDGKLAELEALQAHANGLEQVREDLTHQLHQEKERHKMICEEKDSRSQQLQATLETLQAEDRRRRRQVEELEQSLAQVKERAEVLEKERDELVATTAEKVDIATLLAKQVQTLQAAQEESTKMQGELEQQLNELLSSRDSLEDKLQSALVSKDELVNKLDEREREVKHLEEQVQASQRTESAQIHALTKQLEQLQVEKDQLAATFKASAQETAKANEEQKDALQRNLRASEERCASLKERMNERDMRLKRIVDQTVQLLHLASRGEDPSSMGDSSDDSCDEVNQVRKELCKCLEQLKLESQRKVDQLESKVRVQNNWLEDLKEQRQSLEARLLAESKEAAVLRKAVAKSEKHAKELRIVKSENENLLKEVEKSARDQAELIALKQTLRQSEAKVKNTEEQAQSLHVRMEMKWRNLLLQVCETAYVEMETLAGRLLKDKTFQGLGTRIDNLSGSVDRIRRALAKQQVAKRKEKKLLARSALELRSSLRGVAKEQQELVAHHKENLSTLGNVLRSSSQGNLKQKKKNNKTSSKVNIKKSKESLSVSFAEQMIFRDQSPGPDASGGGGGRGSGLFTKDGHQTVAGKSLGEFKLAVLNFCLKGDAEALKHTLSFGFLREDFEGDVTFLPLHRAITGYHFHGDQKVVERCAELLVRHGVPLGAKDRAGNTVLHKVIQVMPGHAAVDVLSCLIRLGADVNARNKIGDTPLHTELRRIRGCSLAIVEALVSGGASVSEPDGRGLVPMQLLDEISSESSSEEFFQPVVAFLQQHVSYPGVAFLQQGAL